MVSTRLKTKDLKKTLPKVPIKANEAKVLSLMHTNERLHKENKQISK